MKIAYVGRFKRLHDEEYIARSFEALGHEVIRLDQYVLPLGQIWEGVRGCDLVLFCKFPHANRPEPNEGCIRFIHALKNAGIPTATWVFDLYIGAYRESYVARDAFFKVDHLFTTDGGHQPEWAKRNIRHYCVRQGIYDEECVLLPVEKPTKVVFVGERNPANPERERMLETLPSQFGDRFKWYGEEDTHEVRGMDLNRLYAQEARVVVGDSFYSPYYWSNRIVETLGRGGLLIHQDVPGLKEEYPYLVTYERGNTSQLLSLIDYYLDPKNEKERREIIKKNHKWVRDNYTCMKKCAQLLSYL